MCGWKREWATLTAPKATIVAMVRMHFSPASAVVVAVAIADLELIQADL